MDRRFPMERGIMRPRGMMMGGARGYGSSAPAMALRGTRELYDPYRQLHRAGPSAWAPATLLGVVVLITALPYMRAPETAYYRHAVRGSASSTSSFPLPLLWIPVVGFIALQFFGASDWYQGVYVGDRYGARPAIAPGTPWPWSSRHQYHYRYNAHQHRGVVSMFMDFGGHWLLILLGIAVFTLVSSSSVPATPVVPLAPRTLGFPWSWFFWASKAS